MRGLKDPDGGGLLPCRDDGRRRCFVRRRRLSSPWQLSCFGFLFLYGCAGETMTDYLCVDGSSISPSIDTRRGHWKTFSASCFFVQLIWLQIWIKYVSKPRSAGSSNEKDGLPTSALSVCIIPNLWACKEGVQWECVYQTAKNQLHFTLLPLLFILYFVATWKNLHRPDAQKRLPGLIRQYERRVWPC